MSRDIESNKINIQSNHQPNSVKPGNDKLPDQAHQLYLQSMTLINDAIASCNIEGFETAPLVIPQPIGQQTFKAKKIPPQPNFFDLANGIYGQQETLFSETEPETTAQNIPDEQAEMLNQGQSTDPTENTGNINIPQNENISAINDLLNSA